MVHFVQPLGHRFQHLPTRPRTIDLVLQIQYHTMTHPVVVIVTLRVQELLASFTVPRSFAVCGWWSVVQLVVDTFTGELANQAALQESFSLWVSSRLHLAVLRQMP